VDPQRWRRIEEIYHSALKRPSDGRVAFLTDACSGDSELLEGVQSLLAASEQAGSFLEIPAIEDASTLKAAPVQVGSYKILHRVGAGGMGEVFRAHDDKLGRDVAIKTLPAEFADDPERVSRLRREARTLASLNHPNVGTIYELMETDGASYLVLEFVEGETLRGPLPLEKALDYARQIADGMEAAHNKGIVHRDLKPANVKVTPEGRVKVLDFGLAKAIWGSDDRERLSQVTAASGTNTLEGQILGTPPYMSPEQARGQGIDKRTDIWAFGCLLYELLTGKRAFEGDGIPDIVASVLGREPDWEALPPKTPPKIRELLRRCLQKESNRRPADISSIGQTIDEVIASYKGTKRWNIVTAGVAVALAIVLAVILTRERPATPTSHEIRSILVLPFDNESHDPKNEYLSDGIAEGLISTLATLPNVRVVARTTAFRFKGKALDIPQLRKQLDVDAVLVGRLLSSSDNIVVQADLIDAESGTELWGNRFHEKGTEVLSIEQNLVARISKALRVRLTPVQQSRIEEPATRNPEAYKLYLQGRFYWNKRNPEAIRKARDFFEQAIAADRQFAMAYSGLADANNMLGGTYRVLPREEGFRQAREAAQEALRLNPNLAEAHASLGLIENNEFHWAPAEREFKRAIELNPNYTNAMLWYSLLLLARNQPNESLALMRKAEQIDPLSSIMVTNVAMRLNRIGDYRAALPEAQKGMELDPGYQSAWWQTGLAYEGLGNREKAAEIYQRGADVPGVPGNREAIIRLNVLRGNMAEARKLVRSLEQRARQGQVLQGIVGWGYAAIGDRDKAFLWLNRALDAREAAVRDAVNQYAELRGDPRFAELMRRLARGFDD
jgi:serine/threonine protein kinase/tetratricopeptide (TPR) repeat protein